MINNSIIGISAALISTASWALCALLFKKLGERLEPVGMTMLKAFFSCFLLFLIILITNTNYNIGINNIIPIAISGILGIAIGDSLFFASLNRLSPVVLSVIMFVGPDLFSGIFGLIFLKEMPSIVSWLGIFAILAGLTLLIFPVKEENSTKTKLLGLIFAILSLICTAYSMVIIKPVLSSVNVITATMYRMLFSAIVLLVFSIFSKKIFVWKETLSDVKYNMQLVGTFTLTTIGGFWLSLIAIKYCKLIIASSLMSLEPLFIIIFMMMFRKYLPEKKEITGIIFILIGITLLCVG